MKTLTLDIKIVRRQFIRNSLLTTGYFCGLRCFHSLIAAQIREMNYHYPPTRHFGAAKAHLQDTNLLVVRSPDDEFAKLELIRYANETVRRAEQPSIRFGAAAADVDNWRPANSLIELEREVDALAPNRSKK